MTYSEKLKDPRWQKKRLKILERDNWKCTECNAENETLHVHHKRYSGDPWDISDEYLVTMCSNCHSIEEDISKSNNLIKDLADSCNSTCVKVALNMIALVDMRKDYKSSYDKIFKILKANAKRDGKSYLVNKYL